MSLLSFKCCIAVTAKPNNERLKKCGKCAASAVRLVILVIAAILGKSFKPETNLTLGSPSLLLKTILEEYGITIKIWDPYVDGNIEKTAKEYGWNDRAQLFFIGTKHEAFHHFYFHKDSVIIDPFRYLNLKDDVKYIPIGICNQKIE
jgi:UDP-glucose 6-dehydrogenase